MPASEKLDDLVSLPLKKNINKGLKSAQEKTMLKKLGVPGKKTKKCSSPIGDFKERIVHKADVGPFKVDGLDVAVASLKTIFSEIKKAMPDVYAAVRNDGVLCVRHKRTNANSFSNHSWGTAIDLFFGKEPVDQGVKKAHRGVLMMAPTFNKHGWYWGAGFSGNSVDSMHFEMAEETIAKL